MQSPLTALLAALALLVQVVVLPYHQALSGPVRAPAAVDVAAVAAELHATFGAAVALCVHSDDEGAPAAPAGDCEEHCPLCRFAGEAATLVAPDPPALSLGPDAAFVRIGVAPGADTGPRPPASRHRARAPPFAV